ELSGASTRVASGDLKVVIAARNDDEFGLLANTFNSMTQQLGDLIDTLEERVVQRTQELVQDQQRAEQASKAKSGFLSNMSHELRTPRNRISGYSSSMLNRSEMFGNVAVSPTHRPYLQLIQDNGHYLVGLINDILDLSKIEAGRLELNREAIDLNEIFRGVIATSIALLKGRPIQMRPDFPGNLPFVLACPLWVRQVVLHLLSYYITINYTGRVTL